MSSKSKSEPKSKVDWSLESALQSVDENGIYKKITPGLYEGIIASVELKKFDSGAEAFIIEYQLDDGPKKKETLWAVTKAGKPLPGFKINVVQRLMHLGYSRDFITTFKGPQKPGTIGQWEQVINDEHHILLRLDYGKENEEGKSYLEVKQTYKPGTIVDVVDSFENPLPVEVEITESAEPVELKHKKAKTSNTKRHLLGSENTEVHSDVNMVAKTPAKYKAPKSKATKSLATQRVMSDPTEDIAVVDGEADQSMGQWIVNCKFCHEQYSKEYMDRWGVGNYGLGFVCAICANESDSC